MPAQLPIQIDQKRSLPLQTQIFDALRQLILDGTLVSGARLPSTRDLSAQLNVSRTTINIVFERLNSEGYIENRRGAGAFVTDDLPIDTHTSAHERAIGNKLSENKHEYSGSFSAHRPTLFYKGDNDLRIDFRVGRPDPSVFPIKTWRSLASRLLIDAHAALTSYNDPLGLTLLRESLSAHLRLTRGIKVNADQVIIVAGVQEALNLISRVLLNPGANIVIESPTYQGAAFTFQSYGANLVPITVDELGLNTSLLPGKDIRFAYVTPSHQFPLGHTMSLERRLLLLEWARTQKCYIIEDDYDSDFRYRSPPLTALLGLDEHERVIYTSTFSKSLGAGIRLGYLIIPRHLIGPFVTAKALLNNGHPALDQMILGEFLASGGFENHLRKIRKTCLERRNKLVEIITRYFPGSRFSGLEGGMHIVWYLPDSLPDAHTLQYLVRDHGIGIYSLTLGHAHDFGNTPDSDRVILLGYTALSIDEIETGIKAIAKCLALESDDIRKH